MENDFNYFGQNEGIDTICLRIWSFDKSKVDSYIKKHGKKIEQGITIHTYEYFNFSCAMMIPECEIRIQSEALNMDKNIWNQLVVIIYNIYKKNIFDIPMLHSCKSDCDALLQINFYFPLIVELTRLDIHFDFKENKVALINPICFTDKRTGKQSFGSYSEDGKKRKQSHWCCYDRRSRLKAVNQINYDVIMAMQFPMRIEYRFKKKNTQWLNLENLKGDFDFVFNKYVQIMAKSWKAKGCKCAFVIPDYKDNRYFSYLIDIASTGKPISYNQSTQKKQSFKFDENYAYVWQLVSIQKEPTLIEESMNS